MNKRTFKEIGMLTEELGKKQDKEDHITAIGIGFLIIIFGFIFNLNQIASGAVGGLLIGSGISFLLRDRLINRK